MAKRKVVRKKAAPKKAARRKTARKVTPAAVRKTLKKSGQRLTHGYEVKTRTIGSVMSAGKQMLLKDIGNLEAKKFAATLKRDKNKIGKEISKRKTLYRKLS